MIFSQNIDFTRVTFFLKYMIYPKIRGLLKNKRDATSLRLIAYICLHRLLTYRLFTPVKRYI